MKFFVRTRKFHLTTFVSPDVSRSRELEGKVILCSMKLLVLFRKTARISKNERRCISFACQPSAATPWKACSNSFRCIALRSYQKDRERDRR